MLRGGVLTIGSHNICYAHTDADVDHVVKAYDGALARIAENLKDGKMEERLEVPPLVPVYKVRG